MRRFVPWILLLIVLGAGTLQARPRRWGGRWRRVAPRVLQASRDWRIGAAVEDTIWPVRDHDFFELVLPDAGRLVLRHRVPKEIGSALRIHDERGPLTGWHDRATGAEQTLQVDLRRGGSIFVEVADTRDNDASKTPYVLENAFTAHPDGWEPNDSRERARSQELPADLEGRLFPAGDLDRFRFVATERGLVELEAIAVPGPMRLRLETRDGRAFLDWSLVKAAGEKRLVSWPGWGEFHVSLRADDGREAMLEPWKLAVRFHPKAADEEDRIDDDLARARLLPLNERRMARILPRGDRDVWKCYVAGHGRILLHLSEIPAGLPLRVDLRAPFGTSLCGGWKGSAGETSLSVEGAVSGWGWIFVLVDCPEGRSTSLGRYAIRAEFIQRAWVHGQQAPRVHTENFGWPSLPEGRTADPLPVTSAEIEALIGDGDDPFGSDDDGW